MTDRHPLYADEPPEDDARTVRKALVVAGALAVCAAIGLTGWLCRGFVA